MPRVHFVKSARKDNSVAKKGESYYWWKFRFGGKRLSKSKPRPSQLTRSAYLSTVRSLVETVEDFSSSCYEDVQGIKEDMIAELENLRDEAQSSLDNMPDQLQYAPTGELLQERIDALESAIDEISNISDDWEYDEEEPQRNEFEDDEENEFLEAKESWEEDRKLEEESAIDEARGIMIDAISSADI